MIATQSPARTASRPASDSIRFSVDPAKPESAPPRRERPTPRTSDTGLIGPSDLDSVPWDAWAGLQDRAIEPNAYYDPRWARTVARHARGHAGAKALLAWDRACDERLIGLMPVRSARQALALPLPMLVAWKAYASLTIPLLDRDCAASAAGILIDAARARGARALLLPGLAIDGPAYAAMTQALLERGLRPEILRSYKRAALDATKDGDALLREALGAKKLKELRRQRHRLEDDGKLTFSVRTEPQDVQRALEDFLVLEASGWKGLRGTALVQHPGDATFIRQAAVDMARDGRLSIVSLMRNGTAIAAGLILRDGSRAYFFKIAMDERLARTSPGVQLTLDLTRHLCADPQILSADSSTDSEHPMIDHVWRERITIADLFIPLKARDPLARACKLLVNARYRAIEVVKTIRRMREKMS
jgi:CelD/BcsL family acetyltransferase involved in cellulose biosynthesis